MEPSLGTLWHLGRELDASLFDFFTLEESPTVAVTRVGDRTVVEFERARYEVVSRSAQRHLDLFFLRLQPGDGPVRDAIGHAGEECGVVVSGHLEVSVDGQSHELGPGDGIWFVSEQQHTFSVVGDTECVSIWADTIPVHATAHGGVDPFLAFGAPNPPRTIGEPVGPAARRPRIRRSATNRHEPLEVARRLPLSASRLVEIVEHVSGIGSCDLGFRVAGTPEDAAVAGFVADQFRSTGLDDVAVEHVRVDGWRLEAASVAVAGGAAYEAASLGGIPGTPDGGVTASLADVGRAERKVLDRLDLAGRIALVDWDRHLPAPRHLGLELGLRGAIGVIMSCPPGGPYYGDENALGSFHGSYHDGAPPLVTLRKEDAAGLRTALRRGPVEVRLTLRAPLTRDAPGCNAIGYFGAGDPGRPIVIGAHHDGWFRAAFDNATGVAALIAIAEAFAGAGIQPTHRLAFTSRTAEEYGLVGSDYDWCTGAWEQIARSHPEWGANAAFHLNLEASGHPDLRMILEAPPELARWGRAACRTGAGEGWLTSGWRVGRPVTGTEQWPFLLAGVPGVSVYTWETSFATSAYHTNLDTPAIVDFAHLERMTRFYAYLLLAADRDPAGILDHAARARDVVRSTSATGEDARELHAAAVRHAGLRGRAPFTVVGRELLAVDAKGDTCYPHVQSAVDVAALAAAAAALAAGNRRAAVAQLVKVGDNRLGKLLSRDAYRVHRARRDGNLAGDSWAAASHLTASPDLWPEIASLRRERGSAESGPWIDQSINRHLSEARAELRRRLDAMQRALDRADDGRTS